MTVASLLNVPRDILDFQRWSLTHQQDHDLIIDAIAATTGNVTSATLTNGGSGYTSIPNVILDSFGTGATFHVTGQGGVLKTLTVASGGARYRSNSFAFSGGGGTGATATITVSPWVNLIKYQMDPINFDAPADFVRRHAQAHTEMSSVLGLESVDLSGVNFTDENKFRDWIYNNYQEHKNAHDRLEL